MNNKPNIIKLKTKYNQTEGHKKTAVRYGPGGAWWCCQWCCAIAEVHRHDGQHLRYIRVSIACELTNSLTCRLNAFTPYKHILCSLPYPFLISFACFLNKSEVTFTTRISLSHTYRMNDGIIQTHRMNDVMLSIYNHESRPYACAMFTERRIVFSLFRFSPLFHTLARYHRSDNGGCVFGGGRNGPLRGFKATLFEGGTKVDAFVYSPLLTAAQQGTEYNNLMHVRSESLFTCSWLWSHH